MPRCSKCPHDLTDTNGDLLPEYRGVPYEGMPCATCSLVHGRSVMMDSDRSNQGMTTLSFDALVHHGQGDDLDFCASVDPAALPAEQLTTLKSLAIRLASEVFGALLELDSRDRDVFVRRMRGEKFKDIAESAGLTTAWASARFQELRRQWPALCEAIPRGRSGPRAGAKRKTGG